MIGDAGSTHHGEFGNCVSHIFSAAASKLSAIKFQLCPEGNGNIPIKPEWLSELVHIGNRIGIPVSASVWDEAGYEVVKAAGASFIKFAYSQRFSGLIGRSLNDFPRTFVTWGILDRVPPTDPRRIDLWTVTDNSGAVYPVVHPVFHGNLYNRFDGFSCHSLDVPRETLAAQKAGAKFIEFHTRLGLKNDFDVPDGRFAVTYKQMGG